MYFTPSACIDRGSKGQGRTQQRGSVLCMSERLHASVCVVLRDVVIKSVVVVFEDERESVQKKTFAKWVNSHLLRVNCSIQDLYVDLRDGKMLIKLLEVLSGERLVRCC